jgi:hypothetical protein
MTKIAIEANPSGIGTFTIAVPDSNTNRTFALPDTAGGLVTDAQVNDGDNRIINGAFDFWQRGTSGTATAYTAADRWRNDNSGGTVTQSRQSHTVGDKFGVNTPQFYLRQTVSGQSAAGHLAVTFQKIEGVRSYAGETITVLGWARRSSGSGNIAIEGSQQFGTGGSPTADLNSISVTTVPLTSAWEAFSVVINVPSIAGKTLGTNNNDSFNILFWTSAGSDFNARSNSLGIQTIGVDLWGIHIKRGTHTAAATEFYKAPEIGPELARCQRYFSKSYNANVSPAAVTGLGAIQKSPDAALTYMNFGNIKLATEMRASPALTAYNPVTGSTTNPVRNYTANTNIPLVFTDIGSAYFGAYVNNTSVSSGFICAFHYTADAEL